MGITMFGDIMAAFETETAENLELKAASLRGKIASGDCDPAAECKLKLIERILARLNTHKDCCSSDNQRHTNQ